MVKPEMVFLSERISSPQIGYIMASFITMTDSDGCTRYVNPARIVQYYRVDTGDFKTVIVTAGNNFMKHAQ